MRVVNPYRSIYMNEGSIKKLTDVKMGVLQAGEGLYKRGD
jgi:hypothetical protein